MIEYVTIGTNDLGASKHFYDAILEPLGARLLVESSKMVFYSGVGETMLAISIPYDGRPCTAGNGSMFGLRAASHAIVDQVYATAMRNGAASEGAPGFRTPEMYIAYFRDPDGNKLAVYDMPSVEAFAAGAREMVRSMMQQEAVP